MSKQPNRRKIGFIVLAIVAALVAASVIGYPVRYRSPEVSGIAVDKDTDKPIPGLTVTVTWKAVRHMIIPHSIEDDSELVDIHSATTVTDTNGAFRIPAWGPVTFWSHWHYLSNDPTVSFSKSHQNLGFWDNLDFGDNIPEKRFEEIYGLPFQIVDFGKPDWDEQRLKLPQWDLKKPW